MSDEKAFFDDRDPNETTVVAEMSDSFKQTSTNRLGSLVPRLFFAAVVFCLIGAIALATRSLIWLFVAIATAIVAFSCCHVTLQWERAIVIRLGKLHRTAGPGMFFTIPFAESVAANVDMRVRATAFKAERVLTSDLVPVNVDAVLFWGVHNAQQACSEAQNYERLVFWVAQTTLRDVIGSASIAEMSTRRTQIDREVSDILEKKTSEWGISVTGVEIRDIVIPEELQDTLSIEAQAKQEFNARIVLAEVEREVADMFVDAARVYNSEENALQLRAMNFVYEGAKEKGGLVVIPSALSEAFENLGSLKLR